MPLFTPDLQLPKVFIFGQAFMFSNNFKQYYYWSGAWVNYVVSAENQDGHSGSIHSLSPVLDTSNWFILCSCLSGRQRDSSPKVSEKERFWVYLGGSLPWTREIACEGVQWSGTDGPLLATQPAPWGSRSGSLLTCELMTLGCATAPRGYHIYLILGLDISSFVTVAGLITRPARAEAIWGKKSLATASVTRLDSEAGTACCVLSAGGTESEFRGGIVFTTNWKTQYIFNSHTGSVLRSPQIYIKIGNLLILTFFKDGPYTGCTLMRK